MLMLMSFFGAITFFIVWVNKDQIWQTNKKPNQLNIQKAKQHPTEGRTHGRHIGWDVQTVYRTKRNQQECDTIWEDDNECDCKYKSM